MVQCSTQRVRINLSSLLVHQSHGVLHFSQGGHDLNGVGLAGCLLYLGVLRSDSQHYHSTETRLDQLTVTLMKTLWAYNC